MLKNCSGHFHREKVDFRVALFRTFYSALDNVSDFGLMFYNARFYDPSLGRFASADTLIPDPGNPLDYDRYAYVRNNPYYHS